jgi:hypothetical protein
MHSLKYWGSGMNDIEVSLVGTSVRVFEEVAFVMLEPAEHPPEGDLTSCQITFDAHDQKGVLTLQAEAMFVAELSENMMPGWDDPEIGRKCLLEVANIIGGNLLTEIYGVERAVELGLPKIFELEYIETEILMQSENGHVIALTVTLEDV